ncbi:MAG: rhodanese-like domain-containing protein [Chitinophagia bacterium]|jgi:rhodanese-related sulfurtransferase|nr:rhodanese-like domain-containing protein [Chitinophagia bacterium]
MGLNLSEFQQIIKDENILIIDTRDENIFLEGYIPGSIHFKPSIIQEAAALGLFKFDQPLVFVGDDDHEKIAIAYFEKLGFSHIKGYLEGGYATWSAANLPHDLVIEVEVDELAMDIPFDEFLMVLDIRSEEQFNKGHIKNSVHIPLLEFVDPGSFSELDEHFNIYIISDHGDNNTLAASILKKEGIHNIRIVQDGWDAVLFLKDKFNIEVSKNKPSEDEADIL